MWGFPIGDRLWESQSQQAHLVPKVDHSSQEIRLKIVLTGRQNYSPYGCPLHAAWIREKYSLNTICQKCKLDPLPSHYQSVSGYQAPTGIRNSPTPQKCNRNPKVSNVCNCLLLPGDEQP